MMNLRLRLFSLVVLSFVPVLALALSSTAALRQVANRRIEEEASRLAWLASYEEEQLIRGTEQLLIALSLLLDGSTAGMDECDAHAADVLRETPRYVNLGIFSLQGDMTCSALPMTQEVNVSDLPWFRDAIESGELAVGEYRISPLAGRPALGFVYPIVGDSAQVEAAAFATLDLEWLTQQELQVQAQLPEGAVFAKVDRQGTILSRHPDPEAWVGRTLPEAEVLEAAGGRSHGTVLAEGPDGTRRLYGFAQVSSGLHGEDLYVVVGVPEAEAFAPANATLRTYLIGIAASLVLSFGIVWLGSHLLFLRWAKPIMAAAARLAGGDLSARTGVRSAPGEMRAMAEAIDQMADRLEQQEANRRASESRLADSERRLRLIIESEPHCVKVIASDGTITEINPAGLAILEADSAAEVVGKPFHQFVAPDSLQAFRRAVSRVFQGNSAVVEYETIGLKGSRRRLETHAVPIRLVGDEVSAFLGVSRDITEQRLTEEAEREQRALARALGETATALAHTLDFEALLDQILDRSSSVLPHDTANIMLVEGPEAIVAQARGYGDKVPGADLISLRLRIDDFPHLKWMAESGRSLAIPDTQSYAPWRYLPETAWIRSYVAAPIRIHGLTFGFINLDSHSPGAFAREHADRLQAFADQAAIALENAKLLESSQAQAAQLQRILDTVQEGLLALDGSHRVLLANPAGRVVLRLLSCVRLGDRLVSLGGRPVEELITPRADGLPHELTTTGPEPRVFSVYVNPAPREENGRGCILLVRDVTAMRQAEKQIQIHDRLAAVGELASGIAHDFNNIIAAIILFTEMQLRDQELSLHGRERLNLILQQANHATTLTQQILDFGRRSVMAPGPMDLSAFLKGFVKLLVRTLPESIHTTLVDRGEDYVVHADPGRLQQVFMNLALNARDAMQEGGELRFTLSRRRVSDGTSTPFPGMVPGEWIRVTVSDTGVGIPVEAMPHVFEPFFTTKGHGKGTGLGLAQVYGLVQQHGGFIGVASSPGEGTSFDIYLPAAAHGIGSTSPVSETELPHGGGETILLVEDNEAMRQGLREVIEWLGYRVLEAANGRDALAVFEERHATIDLVLTDLVMPIMGGLLLHRALREAAPCLKVVIMSGHPQEAGLQGLSDPGVKWLQKPVDMTQLARLLESILHPEQGQDSP